MKIIYASHKYDYGVKAQGLSYEYCNHYDTFVRMGFEIIYFDFCELCDRYGQRRMNEMLIDVVRKEQPGLLFCVLFQEQIYKETVRTISVTTPTTTINWFCDDHWRFDNYSKYWAPCFNWVTTTASSALQKYEKIGYKNVIKTQWACNPNLYKRMDLPKKYDVTFVGMPHGNRRLIIEALRSAGIDVKCWGRGWENGRLSQDEMIRVFNQSRINLNLSNSSCSKRTLQSRLITSASRCIKMLPYGSALVSKVKRAAESKPIDLDIPLNRDNDQIKGRNFEVPGCGGFLLTGAADNLEDYYKIGQEVVVYTTVRDMIDKIRYYLAHEDEREAIAQKGYFRIIKDHTYEIRYREIFRQMGFEVKQADNEPCKVIEVE